VSNESVDDPHPLRERIASLLFAAYKGAVSPLLHGVGMTQCKFLPTCSEYALAAVVKHGWFRGTLLAARRISRCRPFAEGGFDPVP
jgi:putative membrane protein insertion efficiency factor